MSVRTIFEATDADGDPMLIQTRYSNPSELYMRTEDAVYLTREQVTEMHAALGEWLASIEPTPEMDEPTTEDVERDAQVAELARAVGFARYQLASLTQRVASLEARAANPSPLHQAIADEIRRVAGN